MKNRRKLLAVVAMGGCVSIGLVKGWNEFFAYDGVSDIFYDLMENPSDGYRILHRRWNSYQPGLLRNNSAMFEMRQMAGCCLTLRFWDRLSLADRQTILAEAKDCRDTSPYFRDKQRLSLIKYQIETKGFESLSQGDRDLWVRWSPTFGNVSTPENILKLSEHQYNRDHADDKPHVDLSRR